MCWKSTPKKKKRKWTHNSLYTGFHFFINPNETTSNCPCFNSFWNKWKKSVINMIKNLYYFVSCCNIQRWCTSDSGKTVTTANLSNKLYLFSNESPSKSISVDMNLIFPGVHGFVLPQLFHFLLITKSFYYNNPPCLLSYSFIWIQAHQRYLYSE